MVFGKDLLSGEKVKKALILLASFGAILLLLSALGGNADEKAASSEIQFNDDIYDYSAKLEEKLSEMVKKMTGDGNAKVLVTLEGTFECVYASDAVVSENQMDTKSEKQLVLTGTLSNGEAPVIVKRIAPKVKGAVIVCTGGDDAAVAQKIITLAATALNISTNKIYVTGGI